VRSLVDAVVWDQWTAAFDPARLPSAAQPAVHDFYARIAERGPTDGPPEEEYPIVCRSNDRVADQWCDLCGGLPPESGVHYLQRSATAAVDDYELAPTAVAMGGASIQSFRRPSVYVISDYPYTV
jgi:hypothetical protein